MLAESFRLVAARLIPGQNRCKQGLLLSALILSACGGSGARKAQTQWQTVSGAGARFEAPAGWKVESSAKRAAATRGTELVQVAAFRLVKQYDPTLFRKVAVELRARMQDLAQQTGGKVSGERTVTAGGIKSHAYDVTIGDHVDEYTFVLDGKREFQLLCRRVAGGRAEFCARLVTSFSV